MTMANPYGPESLSSTMGPLMTPASPLVVPPESLYSGLGAGQQAPTLTQPGPMGPGMGVPPPTVAEGGPMMSMAPQGNLMPAQGNLMPAGAPPPIPDPEAAGAPIIPPALPDASMPPGANMTSGETGAPVAAPEPNASQGGPPAPEAAAAPEAPKPPAVPKSLQPAGVANPVGARIGTLNKEITGLEKARNALEGGYAERTAKRGDELQATADDIAMSRNIQNQVDAVHASKSAEFETAAAERADKELADINKAATELGAMKIDPKAALPKTLVGQIGGVIGAMFGAVGQAYGGGPNQFTAMMNHAIETQMRADEANIANKRSDLGTKMSLYGQMRANTQDKRGAALAYRKAAWDYADNTINRLKEKASNADQVQKYDSLQSAIEKERLNDALQFRQARKQEILTAINADEARRSGAQQQTFNNWVKTEELKNERVKAGAAGKAGKYAENEEERKNRATWSQSFGGYVAGPEQVKDANKVGTATDNALSAITRLRHLMKKGSNLSRADIGRAQQAAAVLAIGEKDRNALGALTDSDWSLMPITPAEAMDIFNGRSMGRLDELELFLKQQKTTYRRNNIVRNKDGTPNERKGTAYIPNSLEAAGGGDE